MSSNTTSGADGRTLRVRRRTDVPAHAPIRHFDELPDRGQQLLADLDDRGTVAVAPETAAAFAEEPVVVFSEYLHVELV